MVDTDLMGFYSKIIGDELEIHIIKMLEEGLDYEEIFTIILEGKLDERID